jgi:hypothetical protein
MKKKTNFKKLDEKSVALLRKLALEEVKNEKNSGAISQYGNLPLAELAYARLLEHEFNTPVFIDAEPDKNGFFSKVPPKKRFEKPLFSHNLVGDKKEESLNVINAFDIAQGTLGTCGVLATLGVYLNRNPRIIAGMMRDAEEKFHITITNISVVYINGKPKSVAITETITFILGELLGLENNEKIIVRFFEKTRPKFVIVDKAELISEARAQSPFYVQVFEKAYIGAFLNGDYKTADQGIQITSGFSAFHYNLLSKAKKINLDIANNRKSQIKAFSQLLNPKADVSLDLEFVFNNPVLENKFHNLIKNFTQEKYPVKKSLTPDMVIKELSTFLADKSSEFKASGFEPVIHALTEFSKKLISDEKFQPFVEEHIINFLKTNSPPPMDEKEKNRQNLVTDFGNLFNEKVSIHADSPIVKKIFGEDREAIQTFVETINSIRREGNKKNLTPAAVLANLLPKLVELKREKNQDELPSDAKITKRSFEFPAEMSTINKGGCDASKLKGSPLGKIYAALTDFAEKLEGPKLMAILLSFSKAKIKKKGKSSKGLNGESVVDGFIAEHAFFFEKLVFQDFTSPTGTGTITIPVIYFRNPWGYRNFLGMENKIDGVEDGFGVSVINTSSGYKTVKSTSAVSSMTLSDLMEFGLDISFSTQKVNELTPRESSASAILNLFSYFMENPEEPSEKASSRYDFRLFQKNKTEKNIATQSKTLSLN